MKIKYIVFVFLAIVLGCYGVACAEDGQNSGKPIEVNGDQVEFFPKEKKIVGKGNVTIDYEGIGLTCDRIVVYSETKDSEAEGNVVLKTAGSELKGEKIAYNFGTKVGVILKARASSGGWYAFGDKIELLANSTYRIINGYITSCGLLKPHYKIVAKTVTVDTLNNKVTAKDVAVKVGDAPIAYLPKYHFNLKTEGWPTVSVIPGKKSKWGVFALNSYRYEMDDKNSLTFRVDERSKWGLAEGVDYKYALDGFGNGLLRTYYTNQRNVDRNESQKGEQQRYRIQARHRWDINDHAMAIMEYHRMSDATMTKDYFYREEYNREPSPESYVYVLERQPEYSLSFLGRKRANHFQTVTERLPELRFDLKDQKLFDSPVYFKTDTTFANINQKTSANANDLNVTRFDVYNKLSVPLKLLDAMSVSPFVGMRDTFFSRGLNDDKNEFRSAFYTGFDLSTKFTKTYEASGRFLGVDFNKLRHSVTPTIEYKYIHQPSVDYTKLEQLDDIDAIDQKSVFTLGLENRLQTKRKIGESLKTVDLGYLLITGDYLYKPEGMGSQLSNVKGDLELTPFSWLRLESDTRYDPDTRDFQTWNTDLYINRSEDWRFGLGSRYEQNKASEFTSELFYKLNNAWSFRTFGRYDLKEVENNGHKYVNKFKDKEFTVIKDLHCWLAEVSVSEGRDSGTTVWAVMKLKASPKVPFDFKDYYPHPK
ncbi:MAG: LPS assembly protein LptD [Candidatus Omnitrophota bacterium]|nr:LPS assembly protein LptD [Candidatus Omnitrophota bacterium]